MLAGLGIDGHAADRVEDAGSGRSVVMMMVIVAAGAAAASALLGRGFRSGSGLGGASASAWRYSFLFFGHFELRAYL